MKCNLKRRGPHVRAAQTAATRRRVQRPRPPSTEQRFSSDTRGARISRPPIAPPRLPPSHSLAAPPAPAFEPAKDRADFRVYSNDPADGVFEHYRQMRSNQCVAYADRVEPHVFDFGGRQLRMTVREALEKLEAFVDRSDPDLSLPNLQHALQTAERARAAGKPDWFVLTALIHDVGKMMFVFGRAEDGMGGKASDPQWALGGDTWVLGCAIPGSAVYPALNALNPDAAHPIYGSEMGAYAPGCGIMQLRFSVGHDEYAYRLLLAVRRAGGAGVVVGGGGRGVGRGGGGRGGWARIQRGLSGMMGRAGPLQVCAAGTRTLLSTLLQTW